MPLERPTRGVQGFLGAKWYKAIGEGDNVSYRALQEASPSSILFEE